MILLFIHSVYNSFHLLIPNAQYFPPPAPLTLDNRTTSLFSMSMSWFLLCRYVHLGHILDFTYSIVMLYGFRLSLSDLIHSV